MQSSSGATPLIALDAVAIDTETTGLDVGSARIVEFGGARISHGQVLEDDTLSVLCNPGIAMPKQAEDVHGISDSDVTGAPAFASANAEFFNWCGDRPLIGYAIGFDLAVLEAEAKRHGIAWQRPRTLCVRMLANIANPDLPNNALETLAAWLNIEISGRHRAVGDAIAAGEVFAGLLPHLKARGIRTLAEAERACLRLTTELETHLRAGWTEPVIRPGASAFGKVDPYAYRHRIADVMSAPPLTVGAGTRLKQAIDLMTGKKVSSLFVSASGKPDEPLANYGIITERDVMRRIAAKGADAFNETCGGISSGPIASIRADAFVYRAMGRMSDLKIRHLAVVDNRGNLAGAISARDLLKLRAGAAISLDDRIQKSASAGEMAAAWATLPEVADRLIAENLEARTVAEIVSEELRAMTRQAARLAEAEMLAEGLGEPPCPYAVLVLGSGGRGESLLAADQDNAIIFASGEPGGAEDDWFARLGDRIATILDEASIPLCKGGIMAKNADWRGNTDIWRERISDWVRRASPADLLNVDIVFDLAPVEGDRDLATSLFADAFEIGRSHAPFAKLLAAQLEARENPFTFIGNFKTENGRMDLKKFGLFPIVAGARALAIRHDVQERSTAARLQGLIEQDIGGDADMKEILDAHEVILSAMLTQQARDLREGIPVSNLVETGALDRDQQSDLKEALKHIQIIPDLVRDLLFA
ncbi:MAG: DUF294 nucleotidyltransferase-like domain-containing protein [Rhizobiaceae bacterium]